VKQQIADAVAAVFGSVMIMLAVITITVVLAWAFL